MDGGEIHDFMQRYGVPIKDDRSCNDPGDFFPTPLPPPGEPSWDSGFKKMHCDSDILPAEFSYYADGYEWDDVPDFVKPSVDLRALIPAALEETPPHVVRRRGIQTEMWKTGLQAIDSVN